MPSKLKVGDLVWAKMKGFPYWPGRLVAPNDKLKNPPKKTGFHAVLFFGTRDFAWIGAELIKPYKEHKDEYASKKYSGFKEALSDIEEYIEKLKTNPDADPLEHLNQESEFDRLKENEKEKPQRKPRKDIGVKRHSSTPKVPVESKKSRMSLPNVIATDNGSPTSYSKNHTKKVDDILKRPSFFDVPETPAVDLKDISENVRNKNIKASNFVFGFIGLGHMGSGMVKNLIVSGHKVNIWTRSMAKATDIKEQADRTNPKQVQTCGSPCDVVDQSDIIFCCVSDAAAVKEIVSGNCGVLYGNNSLDGKGYVEMTNIDSESSMDICNLIKAKGGRYLEAQLQGSKAEADDGNLIVLCAGDMSLFENCNSCFTAIGKNVFYLGKVLCATKLNLILQAIKGVALLGLTEGLSLADRAGISAKDVLEVFKFTSFCSPYLESKAVKVKDVDFQTQQPLQHMQKDMRLVLELADANKQPMLMATAANEIYKHARRLGYETYDASSVYMRTRY